MLVDRENTIANLTWRRFHMAQDKDVYTTGFGAPVDNDQNSKTAATNHYS